MEFLNSNPIIYPHYTPSLEMTYMDYFNRALVFAQDNYQDRINKISNTHFNKVSPTSFFEEYAWCIFGKDTDSKWASKHFSKLSDSLTPYYHSFWDLNNFPKSAEIVEKIYRDLFDNKNVPVEKVDSLIQCASIINRGIKLFGWDRYKDNFLNTPEKLCVLPMLGITGAKQLSRNVGASSEIISTARCHELAVHWGFDDSRSLCTAIQKYIPMQLKIIELILWYSATTFPSNFNEP
jgi:hypothetical protein